MNAVPRRITVELAHPEQQLARKCLIRELDCRQNPHQRMPVANRDSLPVPRNPASHDIHVSIIERPRDAAEVRKEEMPRDQPVNARVSCPWLHLSQCTL